MNCRRYERNGSSRREGLATALSGWLVGPGQTQASRVPPTPVLLSLCAYVCISRVSRRMFLVENYGNRVHLCATRSRGFAVALVRLPGIRELVPTK